MFAPSANPHPELSFALDVADKAIKLFAVLLGGVWTWWNYKKSRTYEQKMELQLSGSIFKRNGLYVEVAATLKNLGETKHSVQQEGTYLQVVAILPDLSEELVRASAIFTKDAYIEPGETIHDRLLSLLTLDAGKIVWIRADLRVVSGRVECHQSHLIRVDADADDETSQPG